MACCCGHHHHCADHWCWQEPYPPYRWRGPASPREEYLRMLEEEGEMLGQRLRRLEHELEELCKGTRSGEGRT